MKFLSLSDPLKLIHSFFIQDLIKKTTFVIIFFKSVSPDIKLKFKFVNTKVKTNIFERKPDFEMFTFILCYFSIFKLQTKISSNLVHGDNGDGLFNKQNSLNSFYRAKVSIIDYQVVNTLFSTLRN
jgi:hypothetical protein